MPNRTIHRLTANYSWLVGERVARMILGLFVTRYISRYLNTFGFGVLSGSLMMTSLFTMVANLGIDGVVIRELMSAPEKRDRILGTAWFLKLAGGFLAIGCVGLSALFFGRSDAPPAYMLLVSLAFLPQSFEVIDVWFQKNIQSKYTVMAKSGAYFTGAFLRLGLVYTRAPIGAFCAVVAVEGCLFAIGLVVVFSRNGMTVRAWRFSREIALVLLKNGWPLIAGGILVSVYQRVEQFLVWDWLGASDLGVYNAAGKVTELWGFLPGLLLPGLYPLLAQKKVEDPIEYERRVQSVFDLLTASGLVIAICSTLTAPWVISIIYGKAFSGAVGILMIQAWTAPFTLSGAVRGQFFILEGLTVYHSLAAIMGIAANVVTAILLMQTLGARGAAVGALVGYIVSAFVSSWLFGRLRPCACYQTRSLFIFFRIRSALAEVRRFL